MLYEWFALRQPEFLTCGIPQGTILGQLLFILHINDLPNCLSNAVARMYADDTHLTFACNNIETINDVINHDLSNVNKLLVANKLTLNSSKTELMLFGSQQRVGTYNTCPDLTIDGNAIKQVKCVKSLGVHIDDNLSWNVHIDTISKKIASGIEALKHCRPFDPQTTQQSIYNALIQPRFDYCSEVWVHCGTTLANKLQI